MFFRIYRYINVFSIDVAAGAAICACAVARVAGVKVLWPAFTALAVCVWLIYTVDHLLDARQIRHRAHSYRHQVHQQYFQPIAWTCGLMALAGIGILFYLPAAVLLNGLLLLSLVGIYFVAVRYVKGFYFPKEGIIALVYTLGIFLVGFSKDPSFLVMPMRILFVQLLLVAMTNVVLFAYLEYDSDLEDGQPSIVTHWGMPFTKYTLWLLLGLQYASLAAVIALGFESLLLWQYILLAMTFMLHLIFVKPSWFQNITYRIFGDLVFFFPSILLLS